MKEEVVGDNPIQKEKAADKKAFARMFAEAIATESHAPPAAHMSPSAALLTDIEDEEDPAPPQPPKKTEAEEAELLHIDCNEEIIEINNVRLFSLDEVELGKLTNCIQLEMRKNLIHDLKPAFPDALAKNLVILDLFDNKIRKIPANFFDNFTSLMKLDLSYNQIKKIENLSQLAPTLCELYLVENRLKEVDGLDSLVNLRLLELGGNKIRDVANGLDALVNLEELWLGKNKISNLGSSFHKLRSLKRLSLQANRLTAISAENFPTGANPALEELYFGENALTAIDHVSELHSMKIIDYSMNPIRVINEEQINVSNMPILEEFWLTDGKVDSWGEVDKFAAFKDTMTVVYLERNPIEQDKRYRDKVFLALPFIKQIDSWPVINKNNLEGDRAIHR